MKTGRTIAAAGFTLGVIAMMQSGCAGTAQVAHPTTKAAETAKPAAEQEAIQPRALSGKVVETLKAGGYTYINIEKDGTKTWAAIPATGVVKVGDEVKLKPGMVMHNFASKELNRTFPEVIFSEGLQVAAPTLSMQKIRGTVKETMDAGGYTYVRLESDGQTTWAAIPVTKVTVGQELDLQPGAEMKKFSSKSLNRTFDSIIFSPGIVGAPASDVKGAMPPGHPPIGSTPPPAAK